MREAIKWKVAGATHRVIAERLGVSAGQVSKLIEEGRAILRAETLTDHVTLRAQDAAKLDRMELALWEKCGTGDTDAIRTVEKLMARRAKLFGYEAPVRAELAVEAHDARREALFVDLTADPRVREVLEERALLALESEPEPVEVDAAEDE